MPIRIEMPRLSDTMEEGTLVKWRVGVGDKVRSGDTLADVETDKATMELQAFDDGEVAKICVKEGDTAPVGKLILLLASDGESAEEAANAADDDASDDKPASKDEKKKDTKDQPKEKQATAVSQADDDADDSIEDSDEQTSDGPTRISPLARKLAEEAGLDVANIKGSGPGGRIVKRDVLNAEKKGLGTKAAPAEDVPAASKSSAKQTATPVLAKLEAETRSVNNMRKTIAKRLVESKTTVPHFQVSTSVNVDPLFTLRKTINSQLESQGVRLTVNDFVMRAIALACVQHPIINSSWKGDSIEVHGTVNVGVAIALPEERGGGLVVATVRDVQNLGLRQISEAVKALSEKAKTKGLSVEDMSDSTITVSNLGAPQFGKVTQFTAIINPPNAAILAIGAANEQPVVRNGALAIGKEMSITVSGDHRVIDGAVAAEYLNTLKGLLENPAALLV